MRIRDVQVKSELACFELLPTITPRQTGAGRYAASCMRAASFARGQRAHDNLLRAFHFIGEPCVRNAWGRAHALRPLSASRSNRLSASVDSSMLELCWHDDKNILEVDAQAIKQMRLSYVCNSQNYADCPGGRVQF